MWKQIACIVATNQSQLVTYRLQSHIRQKHPVDKKTVDEISKEKTEGVSQKNMEGKVKTVSDDNTIKEQKEKLADKPVEYFACTRCDYKTAEKDQLKAHYVEAHMKPKNVNKKDVKLQTSTINLQIPLPGSN